MAACRGLLQPIGYLAFLFVLIFFFYGWKVYQKNKEERMRLVQLQRRQILDENCAIEDEFWGRGSLEDMSDADLKHLIVDDNVGIIYCFVPKVACTNWKRVIFVLNGSEPYQDPETVTGKQIHGKLPVITSLPKIEMKAKLKHYTKFLFVRNPFIRIISAYREKFLRYNEVFFNTYGRDILRLYGDHPNPPETVDESFASGVRVTFHNFVQYLLDPKTEKNEPFDPHWRQMERLCHPCHIHYDFIGHQETLQEDAEHLLTILKLKNAIKFPPSYVNVTSAKSEFDWYRTVPVEDRRKLYKLFETDFRLFGYKTPHELLEDWDV